MKKHALKQVATRHDFRCDFLDEFYSFFILIENKKQNK